MRGSHVLLALLSALLTTSLSLAQEAVEAPAEPEVTAAGEAPVGPTNPNPLSSLALESLSATLSAPLFTPSRTAPLVEAPVEEVAAPPPEPEVSSEQPPPSLQLVGIILTEAEKMALLRDPSSNEIHRLNSGDDYEGWSLTVVDARSIEFRSGERVEGLKMFESFPSPASYGMPEGMPIDQLVPEMEGQPPLPEDPAAMEEMPDDAQLEAIPPEEIPPEEIPPENFDPQMSEEPIPEEGPLLEEGNVNAQ